MQRKAARTGTAIRSSKGFNMMEICIAASLMALVSTAVFACLLKVTAGSRALENQTSGVQAVRLALDRLGADVRMARSLGDVFGNEAVSRGDVDGDGSADATVQGTDTFPSANTVANLLGGSFTAPTWADGSAPTSFQLNAQTLVVQVPIFDANGFPTGITAAGQSCSNVETHIYRVLHRTGDPAGTYVMQYLCVPGAAVTGYVPAQHKLGPKTIVSGIVGPFPLSGSGAPQIFQYVSRWNPSVSCDSIPATDAKWIADYTTVSINLEISRQENSTKAMTWAVKQDVSIRNNAQATGTAVSIGGS